MSTRRTAPLAAALAASIALGGCSAAGTVVPPSSLYAAQPMMARSVPLVAARLGPSAGKIQHVIYVMQENRSFDDLWQGYPKADTRSWGYNHNGQKIKLQPIPLEAPYDIEHFLHSFLIDYDGGKMDGFDQEYVGGKYGPNPTYGYVPHYESAPYFKLAHSYVLGDRMFTSHLDASFVSHQYMIAGQAQRSVDLPASAWGCSGGPSDYVYILTDQRKYGSTQPACYSYTTLAQELDKAGLPWRIYSPSAYDGWEAYQAISYVYNNGNGGPDWNNIIAPNTQFFNDVKAGTLGAVTWITPTCQDSDHGGCEGNTGPQWVTSIVDAVGQSQFRTRPRSS